MQTYKFHVNGMHCQSCVVLTESELKELPGVQNVKASLDDLSVEVSGDFENKTADEIATSLTCPLKPHGYSLSTKNDPDKINWSEFYLAIPIAAIFVIIFFLAQKLGLANFINSSKIGFGTSFVVGLIASVSTCMAVVGGLVLSVSANFAKDGNKTKPQLYFHLGRLISFFILGGAIGALGSVFQLGIYQALVINIILALILLVLGINLLEIFPWAKKLQPTMPKVFGKNIYGLKKLNHTLTPALLGIATFFMPCGFTQSMQFYTLTTGSFWVGGLTMLAFALGTLPILAILSFSSLAINKSASGIFFKTVGIVVILFGILNLINSFVGAGLISPIFNF